MPKNGTVIKKANTIADVRLITQIHKMRSDSFYSFLFFRMTFSWGLDWTFN
jgi:hypothetical protein